MELDNQQKNKMKNFVDACNDFLASKFILSDIKISKILKTVADSEQIYNLLAECMINFNYEEELNRSFFKGGNGGFYLPPEYFKLIPLVFNLLVSLDSKKIEFKDFLQRNFGLSNQNEQYSAFGHTVILPFRDAIIELFGMDATQALAEESTAKKSKLYEKEQEPEVEAQATSKPPVAAPAATQSKTEGNEFKAFFNEVKKHANYIADKLVLVKKEARRENVKLIVNAIMRTCDLEDIVILSALVSSLNEIAAKEKYLKYGISKICECYYEFILKRVQE